MARPTRNADPEPSCPSFAERVDHDLRQPIQSLQLLADAVARHATTDPLREASQHMRRMLNELTAMQDALLELSRLEEGRAKVRPQSLVLVEIADAVVRDVGPAAEARRLAVRLGTLDAVLDADERWLREILRGLLLFSVLHACGGEVALDGTAQGGVFRARIGFEAPASLARQAGRVFIEFPEAMRSPYPGLGIALGPGYLERLCPLLGYRLELPAPEGGKQVISLALPLPPSAKGRPRG